MIKNDVDYLIRRTYTNYGGRKMCADEIEKAIELLNKAQEFPKEVYLNSTQIKYKEALEKEGYKVQVTNYLPDNIVAIRRKIKGVLGDD